MTRQLANGKRLWVAQRLMWAEHELRQAARSLEEAKALPDLHRELRGLADVVAGHVSVVKRGRSEAGTTSEDGEVHQADGGTD